MKKLILTISILFFGIQTFAQAPIISVDPDSLSENLFFARASTQTLTISNTGDSDLIYQIETNILIREGYQNYALQFDGVDDYVNVPEASSLDLVNQVTLETWFNWKGEGIDEWPAIVCKGRADYENYALFINKSGRLIHFVLNTQYGRQYINSPADIVTPNTWHYVSATYDGNFAKIYFDGQLIINSYLTGTLITNSDSLMIGCRSGPGFNGQIDELRIWNIARTQQEIQQSMYRQLSGLEQGLVGYWQCDEGSGTTAFDKTLNGNNGALNGGTQWVESSAPVAPYFWIMVNPDSGVVAPGSFVDLETSFDAAGLSSGYYDAEIIITSNDPVTPELTVPAHLTINDAPAIQTEIDSINFGEIFLGVSDTFYLEVRNIGSQDLLIFNAVIQPNEYSVYPTFAGIDVGDSEIFTIKFLPQTVGNYPGELTFSSNDPVFANYTISIRGQGVEPPIILFSPDSIYAEVLQGETVTKQLIISNQGGSNLYFDIDGGFNETNFALQFDGVNGYVSLADANELGIVNKSFTVESWIKITNYVDGDAILGATDPGKLHFVIRDYRAYLGFWGNDLWGDTTIETGNWYHLAWRYQIASGEQAILINGKLDKAETGHPPYQQSGMLNIGKWEIGSYHNGMIDDFRIWNYARTEAEIQSNMNEELFGTESGLIGYWNFNEGVGNTIYDKTSNGNNGLLQGGVVWTDSSAPLMPPWLLVNPDTGVCAPNSTVKIEVFLDATELDSGDFYGSLVINSNDPVTPSVIIPVHLKVEAVVGIEKELNVPSVYELYQNYPNPFNPSTKIKYSIPEISKVTLTLFSLLGEEIKTLVNEEKTAGNYEVEFNASNLPSGVYFYRLQAGSFVETKKMLLLK